MLLLGAGVAAFAAGLTLDLSRWRDAAARQASAALGRPVAVQGALQLALGRPLRLRIGELRIASPPDFGDAPFASVGQATVRIDLLDALRGRMRLRGLEASDIEVRLQRADDGRGNWSFAPAQPPASPPSAIDIGPIKLQRLVLRYHDPRAASQRSLELDELSGSLRPDDPLQLALQGRVDGQPCRLRLEGGTLQALRRASEPWPFRLELKSAVAWLQAQGTFDARRGQARFYLGAGADDLARAAAAVGVRWPLPGGASASASASVVASADEVALADLQGLLGEAGFSGQLHGSFAAARPRLSGALRIASLDLRRLLQADAPAPGEAPVDARAWQTLALRGLVPWDLDLELRVDRWLGLPVPVDDAKLALRADPRGVRAPLNATLAGAALTGQLDLDLAVPTPTLALRLDARDLALDALARDLPVLQGLEGRLGHAVWRLGGRGDTPADMLREPESSLAVQAAQVRWRRAGLADPIAFTLDALQLQAGRGERLRGRARGTLLGQPTRLSVRAGTWHDMLRERALPLQLELDQAQARLRVEGLFGPAGTARSTALGFDLQADSAGSLARWLPVAPQSGLPLALRGQLRMAPDAWSVEQTTLELGRSRLLVDARHDRSSGRPLTTARVRSPLIDAAQLATLLARGRAPAQAGTRLDAPLLAGSLHLADADLDLQLRQVWLGRTELADVVMSARAREGRLLPSPASGRLAGAPFTALVALDARGEVPSARLDLSARDIDIGALLGTLGVAEGLDARAGSLQLALQARGNSLRELAAHTALDAQLSGGSFSVPGSAQRPAAEIRLHEAGIEAPAGEPIRLRLNGMLDETPMRLQLSTGSFADFAGDVARVPFALQAQAAGTRLSLEGEAALPLGRAGQLTLEMGGQRLDSLNDLVRVELPPWGPWSLRGPIRKTAKGYDVQALTLAVGQSRLGGSGQLDLSGPRPRAEVRVAAPSIQLDDFPMPQRLIDAPEPALRDDGLRGTAMRTAGRIDRMLGARFLRRFDATVAVQADEVLAGTDRLADGAIQLTLQQGRLALDPAVLNLPGGSMRLSMVYDLKQSEVDFQVAAQIERFDYGIIARRLRRADDLRGLFSLNLALAGTAPSLDAVMPHASGTLDVAVWPTEMRAGVFNLWSANLVLTLLPLIDPGQKSQVNCIVGRFDLKDGDLRDDKFLIDTTTVRIRGTGHADLRAGELEAVFRPRAKGLGLFRLQTPLRVSGTLFDQRFQPTEVVPSMLRMIASPVLVPIEYFTLGPLPRDGADVCTDPIRGAAR